MSYGRKPEPGGEVIKETFDNTEIKEAESHSVKELVEPLK